MHAQLQGTAGKGSVLFITKGLKFQQCHYKYGLGTGSVGSCHCSSVWLSFVTDTSGKQLILDLENSAISLPTVNENTEVSSFGSYFGNDQIVMDFENSRLYSPYVKEGVSSIATRSDFMTAFTGWDLYGSDAASNTICANSCERFLEFYQCRKSRQMLF
nr:hypothetical protein [Tanacetum cinerariifolium]